MIDLWTFGVLGFLAIAWSISECILHHQSQKALREREEMMKRFWRERIEEEMRRCKRTPG